ncbi:DUF1501 domain-containing protein [bacterium]|nr:DUF1501 domain-containing protein [bacterium]
MNLSTLSSADLTRRAFLGRSAGGLGSVALASLMNDRLLAGQGSMERYHHAPKAKRVIFLFMAGGPSHIDLFDPKPKLNELDGKTIPEELLKDHQQFALIRGTPNLKGSPYAFRPHGESGTVISELMPHLATVADELTVVRSMHTNTNVHDPGVNFMNCGTLLGDRPTLGSWMSYGLGSANDDIPAYTVLTSGVSDGQPLLQSFWGNGFLESRHAGVPLLNSGAPVLYLDNPKDVAANDRRRELDLLKWMNIRQHQTLGDPEIKARIESYELAFRMQASVPELADLGQETDQTMEHYGADRVKPSFARNCLMARRLVERGVRFVQLYDRGWDSHTDMDREHRRQCGAADQPIAALIADLKQRGMLDDTLVIWGGEFGRTPVAQVMGQTWGRDHHPHGFTMWMAGGGMKPGLTYGATDEFGYHAVEDKVHVHDLHATILHQLGIDHKRLTFRSQGRDFRLTDVHGKVLRDTLS